MLAWTRIFSLTGLLLFFSSCIPTSSLVRVEEKIDQNSAGIEEANRRLSATQGSLERTQGLLEDIRLTQSLMDEKLEELLFLARQQGAGEITLFFAAGQSHLIKDSFQYQRLVTFLDHLSTVSAGRKIYFLTVGSASPAGSLEANLKLSERRSLAPLPVLEGYLMHVPHEVLASYGVGEPPPGVLPLPRRFYRQVRLIAVFDPQAIPAPLARPEGEAPTF